MSYTPFGYIQPEADTIITGLDPSHTSHTLLLDIGTNSHAQLDTFVGDINSKVNQDVRTTASPTFAALTTATINGNPNLDFVAPSVTINGGSIMTASSIDTLTNKSIDTTTNTITMGHIIGTPTINNTINQQLRTTDNANFGSVSTIGGVFAGSGCQGLFGHFNTINSQATDNTCTVNGVNPLTTDTNFNVHSAASTAHGTTSTIVGINDSQRLTNKNIAVPSCALVDNSDSTKKITFNDASATTGTTLTIFGAQTANRSLTLPDATDTIVARATNDTFTNKTFDTGVNTFTLTNLFLTGVNINNILGQALRNIDSPTFAALTTATLNGNTNLAINAGNITATTTQPFSLIVNNTSATFSNELRIQNNGTTIIGFGNNNTSNEAFCWAYANVPLKFATNSAERLRIPAAGIANDNTITSILGLQGTSLVFKNNVVDTSSSQTLTNKTLDSASNTLTITNSPLSATNVNSLINQDVRTTAEPTFTTFVHLTQAGNASFEITGKGNFAHSGSNGAFFTSAVTNDINLRQDDNTKNLNLGVGTGTAQLRIDNTGVNYNVGQNTFISGVKTSSITPVTGSQTNNTSTTIFSFTLATSQAIYIYVSVISKKLVGTQTGWTNMTSDFKVINNATVVTANAGSFGSSTSQTAIAGTYNGKLTLSASVASQTVSINLANTYADNPHQYTAEVDVMYVA